MQLIKKLVEYYKSAPKRFFLATKEFIELNKKIFKGNILRIIVTLFEYVITLLYHFSLHTFTFIATFHLLLNPSLESVGLLFLCYSIDNTVRDMSTSFSSYKESKDLLEYQDMLVSSGFQLELISLEDYFQDDKLSDTLHENSQEFLFDLVKKLGKIAIAKHEDTCSIGGFKAFPNRGTFRVVDGKTTNITQAVIFVDGELSEMSGFRRFMLLHELGHLSNVSLIIESMRLIMISHLCMVLILMPFLLGISFLKILGFVLPIFILKLAFNTKSSIEKKAEEYSDLFALSFFDKEASKKLFNQMSYIFSKARIRSLDLCYKLLQENKIELKGFAAYGLVHTKYLELLLSVIPVCLITYFSVTVELNYSFLWLIIVYIILSIIQICIPMYISLMVSRLIPDFFDTEMK